MTTLNPDSISRSDLALIDDGAFESLEDARAFLSSFQPLILVGAASCSSRNAQAAALAVATTAVRAFGGALAILPSPSANQWPGSRANTFAEAMESVGATVLSEITPGRVCILIGDATVEDDSSFETVLRVTWESWTGMVTPGPDARRLVEDDTLVLAPIVAAGLAISELFEIARHRLQAGDREIALNLWTMKPIIGNAGPQISDVPATWWLIGLGHLGQANAWVLSWLPTPRSRRVAVTLQDDEVLIEANLSTSLCASPADLGLSKARTVAGVLESAGYETRLIERRLDASFTASSSDYQVVLFGVDNAETRRAISDHRWPLAIDVGLGSGSVDFGAMSLHVFPGSTRSDEIASWSAPTGDDRRRTARRLEKPGFKSLLDRHDVCGVEMLAGVNVAASFVGMVSACVTVSEVLRRTQGGPSYDSIGIELWDLDPMSYGAKNMAPPPTLRL
jgi:hypothetical protein